MRNIISGIATAVVGAFAALPALAEGAANGAIPDPAARWDHLWHEILIDITVIGVVLGFAAIYMLFKYKAKDPTTHGQGPRLSFVQALSWALIPSVIFMADDFFLSAKGWSVWNVYRRVPDNAMEIKVTAYQWYWEYQYPNGVVVDTSDTDDRAAGTLMLPVGTPVVFRMTSEDVIHSFFLPNYRVKEDVMPGRQTYVWVNPIEPKESVITCTEYCGIDHTQMWGKVKAVPQAEFDQWLAKRAAAS